MHITRNNLEVTSLSLPHPGSWLASYFDPRPPTIRRLSRMFRCSLRTVVRKEKVLYKTPLFQHACVLIQSHQKLLIVLSVAEARVVVCLAATPTLNQR